MTPNKTTEQPIPSDFKEWADGAKKYLKDEDLMIAYTSGAFDSYRHLHPLPPSPVGEAGDEENPTTIERAMLFAQGMVDHSPKDRQYWKGHLDALVFAKEWLDESPNPSRAGEPKRIIPEGSYFVAQCEKCGFKGASSEWNGGGQIADTGDYGDSYCPVCGHVDVPEADDDIYIDQRELFMTKIWQLGNRISQLEWELYESKTERAGESDSEMRNNAIAFTIWAAEKGWLLHPDQDEDEEYGFYKPSDDFDIPDERLFGGQLYDLYLQHLNDSK